MHESKLNILLYNLVKSFSSGMFPRYLRTAKVKSNLINDPQKLFNPNEKLSTCKYCKLYETYGNNEKQTYKLFGYERNFI